MLPSLSDDVDSTASFDETTENPGGRDNVWTRQSVQEAENLLDLAKTWMVDDLTYAAEGRHRDYGHALLREPAPWGVHFAGTETEAQNGHVEGAIRAGERAAAEVLESLADSTVAR